MRVPAARFLRALRDAPRSASFPASERARRVLPLLIVLAVIALLTLAPGKPEAPDDTEFLDPYCLICGRRGGADAVLNILLFVPLGLAAARVWGWVPSVLFGVAVSAGLELAQTTIPNRFPTVGDIVWNGAGAGLGATLLHGRAALAAMGARARLVTAAALVVLPLLPAALRAPAPTRYDYFPQLAPTVSERSYGGRVTAAALEDMPLAAGRARRPDAVRDALRRGAALSISFVAVESSEVPSYLFRFVDSRGAEIVSLAVRGQDLVWMERTTAGAAGFWPPRVTWEDALSGTKAGSEVSLIVRKEGGSVCMRVDARERCGLAVRPRDGWQLLLPPPPVGLRAVMAILWLVVPAALAGLATGGLALPTAGAVAVGVVALWWAGTAPGMDVGALDFGLLVGALLAASGAMRAATARGRKTAAPA
jgi:hypothetical protein